MSHALAKTPEPAPTRSTYPPTSALARATTPEPIANCKFHVPQRLAKTVAFVAIRWIFLPTRVRVRPILVQHLLAIIVKRRPVVILLLVKTPELALTTLTCLDSLARVQATMGLSL